MGVEEISEGLKIAMSKGESLQQAMQSFYSAGYSMPEVEAASKMISGLPQNPVQNSPQISQQGSTQNFPNPRQSTPQPTSQPSLQPIQVPPKKDLLQPQQSPMQPIQTPKIPQQQIQRQVPFPNAPQNVSGYGINQTQTQNPNQPEKDPRDTLIILIIVLLAIFGLIIVGIFIFRSQIVELLNSLFG